jgi:pimeloyl-ACP methyl ester carboxylesterase
MAEGDCVSSSCRLGTGVIAAALALAAPAPRADAAVPRLDWRACSDGFECAEAPVPRDHAHPEGREVRLAVARLPAHDRTRRIGSLFVNFGGPGGSNVATLKANAKTLFARLNDRFDVVAFDPRGTGESRPAIDCAVDQEHAGPFAQPFMTPFDVDPSALVAAQRRYVERCAQRNREIAPYVATANVARDLDVLRRAVGDARLTYLGLSYGSYLGATYAALFPRSYRALALEGALDPDRDANHPLSLRAGLAAAQERALARFLQTCARACAGFGGDDPQRALDALLERLDRSPLTVGTRRLDGDDVRVALGAGLHARSRWPALARALAAAEQGDGTTLRELADGFYGRQPDGRYRPLLDQFFAVSAADQRAPRAPEPYLAAGADSWRAFDHAYFLAGYGQRAWALDRNRRHGAFHGPFRVPGSSPTVLVVGTTFDPATPYKDAQSLTRQLGNARLLTMDGDGHGAYGGESACIDAHVDAYLLEGSLPDAGTRCAPLQIG